MDELEQSRFSTDKWLTEETERPNEVSPKMSVHAKQVREISQNLPPLDMNRIARARVQRLPKPSNKPMWSFVAAIAALFLVVVMIPSSSPTDVDPPTIGIKGNNSLSAYVITPTSSSKVKGFIAAGSTLGFAITATSATQAVVVSIDDAGKTSLFWPESIDQPPIEVPPGVTRLRGSVVTDDAMGDETFMAIFGLDTKQAMSLAKENATSLDQLERRTDVSFLQISRK